MKTTFAAIALSFAILMSVQAPVSATPGQPAWAEMAFGDKAVGD